jgi:hypothetical protein
MISVALLALLGSTAVEGHKGCGGGEIMRRNPGGALVTRDEGTWQSEAALGEYPPYRLRDHEYMA